MKKRRNFSLYLALLAFIVGLGSILLITNPGSGASLSLITPYVNESDMALLSMAFCVDECAPWDPVEHRGIDFFPTGTIGDPNEYKSYQSVCDGVVKDISPYYNPGGGPNNNGQHQVNILIEYDATYSVIYAFETWSESPVDGNAQLNNIFSHISVNQNISQGHIIGELVKAGDAAHVHFGLRENGLDICPEYYFTPAARTSILNVLRMLWPHARMCYGLEESIPTASISLDGNTADWAGIDAMAGDWENDDIDGYSGADIEAIYLARDAANLYLRMDLYGIANTDFGNGPYPNEGRYAFYLENDGPYPFLYLAVAYDKFNSQWSLGFNGSNGPNTPGILIGPQFVGVNGGTIEIGVPLSVIGSSLYFSRIHGEVVSCCIIPWAVLDETHCVSNLTISGGPEPQTPAESIKLLISYIEDLNIPRGIKRSCISKLESAIHSLEKKKPKAAKNKLKAFINHVEAQDGKKIPHEVAIGLIDAAESIISSI